MMLLWTVIMTILNIVSSIFTYRIFKYLSMGDNMGKKKKISFGMSKRGADKLFDNTFGNGPHVFSVERDSTVANNTITDRNDNDNIKAKEDFDGSFSNPFIDRELDYVLPKAEVNLDWLNAEKPESSGGNSVNIPIITDEDNLPEDDERMLNRLLFLSDYLNGKYKPHSDVSEQEFEDMKWETINETYCLITVDLPRKKAEVIRKYFRRLDTTYAKQDGTYYSKVTRGELAKEVIDDLIEIYPWYEEDKSKVKVNWDAFRKSNTNVIKINPSEGSDDHVYMDRLKYAIGNLGKSIEKLNEILSGK